MSKAWWWGLACVVAVEASAVPMQFPHQGRVLDTTGAPVNGMVDLRFRI
jgi:hypothetical protein